MLIVCLLSYRDGCLLLRMIPEERMPWKRVEKRDDSPPILSSLRGQTPNVNSFYESYLPNLQEVRSLRSCLNCCCNPQLTTNPERDNISPIMYRRNKYPPKRKCPPDGWAEGKLRLLRLQRKNQMNQIIRNGAIEANP